MSKTVSLHHIVFPTKHREPTITPEHKRELYAYIFGIIRNLKCFVHRINGMADHIHILIDLHPSVSLAGLVRDVKRFSTFWLKNDSRFEFFAGWSDGYYASSVSPHDLDSCRQYIINQESHHARTDFVAEAQHFAAANGLSWYDDDLR